MLEAKKKFVLVTGCSSGIGLATALELKKRGHFVIATARKKSDLEQLRQQGLHALSLDLRHSNSIKNLVENTLLLTEGKIDCIINNAGYSQPGAIEDISRQALRSVFEVNVFGAVELVNSFLPTMRAQKNGRIIQISSAQGILAMPYRGAYSATKFALEAVSDCLRLELQRSGIKVVIVQPGPVLTKFKDHALNALNKRIDLEGSVHKDTYHAVQQRLLSKKTPPYAISSTAIAKKIAVIAETNRPKIRYRITLIAHLFEYIRRLFPYRLLNQTVKKLSGSGAR